MNRRTVIGAGVALVVSNQALAQSVTRVKITEPEKLKKDWDDAEFTFQNQACVLVRVPTPTKTNPRLLEYKDVFYAAYSRTCTHIGCISQLPNNLRQLECGCHGSVFSALDGSVIMGPATTALRAIELEIVSGSIFAVNWQK